jgi:hypothetical protein
MAEHRALPSLAVFDQLSGCCSEVALPMEHIDYGLLNVTEAARHFWLTAI